MRLSPAFATAIPTNLGEFLAVLGTGERGFSGANLSAHADLRTYVQRLEQEANGVDIPAAFVPMSTFWLLDDRDQLIGMSRLRHRLNERLRFKGGHIGFYVAPTARRRRAGSHLLRETLVQANALGIAQVLLTTDRDNLAAQGLIERHGGVAEDRTGVRDPELGTMFLRYWITLSGASKSARFAHHL